MQYWIIAHSLQQINIEDVVASSIALRFNSMIGIRVDVSRAGLPQEILGFVYS